MAYKPPQSAATVANRALKWRREFGRGGTEVGVARARDIANRKDLSDETIGRMVSFFARHAVNKQATGFNSGEDGFPSAGRIAWDLWGGDPGRSWAERIWQRIKKGEDMEKAWDGKKKKKRLRKLEISRVDIVDRPSNPGAQVMLFKRESVGKAAVGLTGETNQHRHAYEIGTGATMMEASHSHEVMPGKAKTEPSGDGHWHTIPPEMVMPGEPEEYDHEQDKQLKIKITVFKGEDSPAPDLADGSSSAPQEEKGNAMSQKTEQAALDKSLEDRIQELEKSLKAKDERIAELEKAADASAEVAKKNADPEPEDVLKALPVEVRKQFEELQTRVAKAEADAKRERDERLTRDYIAKAEQFKSLAINPAEFGPVLKALSEAAPEVADTVHQVLKAADAQMEKAGLFKELGSGASEDNATAFQRLEGIAKSLVDAGKAKNLHEGFAKAASENPTLYDAYRRGE